MLRDVVFAVAVELDENVVEWLVQLLFEGLAQSLNSASERYKRRGLVTWVSVDRNRAIRAYCALHGYKTRDLPAPVTHRLEIGGGLDSLKGLVCDSWIEPVVNDSRVTCGDLVIWP